MSFLHSILGSRRPDRINDNELSSYQQRVDRIMDEILMEDVELEDVELEDYSNLVSLGSPQHDRFDREMVLYNDQIMDHIPTMDHNLDSPLDYLPRYSVSGQPLNQAATQEVEERNKAKRLEELRIVKEIHEKVDNAALRLIDHSPRIAAIDEIITRLKSDPIANRAARRKAIGFGVTKQEQSTLVQLESQTDRYESELRELNKERSKVQELEAIRLAHPGRNFILRSDLDEICKDYHLALGYTLYYVGDIPEKNLTEIENYVPLEEELKPIRLTVSHQGWGRGTRTQIYLPSQGTTLEGVKQHMLNTFARAYIGEQYGENGIKRARQEMDSFVANLSNVKEEPLDTFLIACPHIDLTQTLNHVTEKYVNDPIVCKIISKPYILEVVTKWGPEAEAESVKDPELKTAMNSTSLN